MSNRRKQNRQTNTAINEMNESLKSIAQNAEQTSKNTGEIKSATNTLSDPKTSKFTIITTIIAIIIAFLTLIVAIITLKKSPSNESAVSKPAPTEEAYTIYLYPEYSKLRVGFKTDITATLNFDTDSVSITAYHNSVKNGDTVIMKQKNSTEWQKKVEFTETGVFEVIATATAPDGTIVEGSVEVEVY